MFKFAVVDNDQIDLDKMIHAIKEHCEYHRIKYKIDTYTNPLDFKFSEKYDAVFLDIDMPQQNGLMLAKNINERNNTNIIFVTNYSNYVHVAYDVHPFHFIHKQNLKPESIRVLSLLFNHINAKVLKLKTKRGEADIRISDISYIAIENSVTQAHVDDKAYTVWDSISSLYSMLKVHQFEKISQSTLINLSYVESAEYNKVTLKDGTEFTISIRMRSQFQKTYQNFLMLQF